MNLDKQLSSASAAPKDGGETAQHLGEISHSVPSREGSWEPSSASLRICPAAAQIHHHISSGISSFRTLVSLTSWEK